MNRERLRQMVVMLRGLPPENEIKFDLRLWYCGTSACAVGHACIDPVFMAQGLYWNAETYDPGFDGELGWAAVQKFFDITEGEDDHLFSDWGYESGSDTTPSQVADRIEAFIAA